VLEYGATLVDAVRYDTAAADPFPTAANGHALHVSGAATPSAAANDAGSAWCQEDVATFGNGDFGTPGQADAACP